MSWKEITVRKPGRIVGLSLGQDAFKSNSQAKPIPRAATEVGARQSQHVRCVEHVEVPGVPGKVCILRGQDRDLIIAEARELAGAE